MKRASNHAQFRLLSPDEATNFDASNKAKRKSGTLDVEDPWIVEDPWKQSAPSTASPHGHSSSSGKPSKSKLVELSLRKGDWVDEQQAEARIIKLEDVVQSSTGICALDEPTAITLLGGPLKSWSAGPLIKWPVEGLFFIAEDPRGRLHRVKGFLVQLGDMSVRRKCGPQLTMQKPCGVEVVLQASKKYVAPEMWSKLWESPVRTLIELLFPDGAKPESRYSRRWLPKARFDATVFQTTCRLDAAVFATLRKTCSQRGSLAQRKREEVPDEFIAWLPVDVSLSEARAQQQQHDSQVNGLICVKDRLRLSTSQSSLPALLKAVRGVAGSRYPPLYVVGPAVAIDENDCSADACRMGLGG